MAKEMNKKTQSMGRKVCKILVWSLLLLYYPVVLSFVSSEKAQTQCNEILARVTNKGDDVMMTDQQIMRLVNSKWPSLKDTKLCELDLQEMENVVEKTPAVMRCEIYPTPGGVLHVEVWQREPIMHVFTSSGSYYMDDEATIFRAERDMYANTIVVNGAVNSSLDEVDGLISLCKYIRDDAFWHSQIEQVYVTEKLEFILVPRVGDHVVEFGKVDRMEEKFEELFALYSKGWKPQEWNSYKRVNLKYKGQIICTKK